MSNGGLVEAAPSSAAIVQPSLMDVVDNRIQQSGQINEAATELKALLEEHPELDRLVTCLGKLGVIHLYL